MLTTFNNGHLLESIQAQLQFNGGSNFLYKDEVIPLKTLYEEATVFSTHLRKLNLPKKHRIAYFSAKSPTFVISLISSILSDSIFVPINPLLKPKQVDYILNDCQATMLITDSLRYKQLLDSNSLASVQITFITDHQRPWSNFYQQTNNLKTNPVLLSSQPQSASHYLQSQERHCRCILYTSGSTGMPKGVAISDENLFLGAQSVSNYLGITQHDRLLGLLPFSFDYGLNQLFCCLFTGADLVLQDYFLPLDVQKSIYKYSITGLAAVPPIWKALAKLDWGNLQGQSLRFFTNSGGKLPKQSLNILKSHFPNADAYLMYGLTESFRSTFLPPDLNLRYPESVGKAIPNATVYVLSDSGEPCAPNEQGELVHCGPLVTLGYWNNYEATLLRFKKAPAFYPEKENYPVAVWSGDTFYTDENGLLYFVGRRDEQIKISGYRISPEEIESCIVNCPGVSEVVITSIITTHDDPEIVAIVKTEGKFEEQQIIDQIKRHAMLNLPNYMQPKHIWLIDNFPLNANGKYDRSLLQHEAITFFSGNLSHSGIKK